MTNAISGPESGVSTSGSSKVIHENANNDDTEKNEDLYECSICLDRAKNPVVSICGHLFCWSCINRWLNGSGTTCPMCKSSISKEKIIPIYGRGCSKEDPRKLAPGAGQRTEPEQRFFDDGGSPMEFAHYEEDSHESSLWSTFDSVKLIFMLLHVLLYVTKDYIWISH